MRYLATLLLLAMSSTVLLRAAESKAADRLQKSADMLNAIMKAPKQGIPSGVLEKAVCVAVVPSYRKGAVGIGAGSGNGVLVCRRGGNGPWGAPWMFKMGRPSIGLQVGVESADLVLLIMNPKGAREFISGQLTLGKNASVAAGPVGRTARSPKGVQLQTDILSYSRTHGVFAGLSLEDQVINDDGGANKELYGKKITARDILFGDTTVPAAAGVLDSTLGKYSPRGGQPFPQK